MRLLLLFALVISFETLSQESCPAIGQYFEQPTDTYQSTLNDGTPAGEYVFLGSNGTTFIRVIKAVFNGESPPNEISGVPLNACQYNPFPSRDCEYRGEFPRSCGAGYLLDGEQCLLIDEALCLAQNASICSDGLPAAIGGYSNCDRPDFKTCSDGSYVRNDTGICPVGCSDYGSCREVAQQEANCPPTSLFEFIDYVSPRNYSYACTELASNSPDNPNNGGNADGNPYNDPNTPESGEGSTPNSSEIDPYSFAEILAEELGYGFDNVERAVREGTDQSKVNTETLETAIFRGSDDTIEAIDRLSESVLASSQEEQTGPCDPSSANYLDCLEHPQVSSIPHRTRNTESFEVTSQNYVDVIKGSQLVLAFENVRNLIKLSEPQCPTFSIAFPEPINYDASTVIHCELWDTIAGIIRLVMLAVYVFIGFKIVAGG